MSAIHSIGLSQTASQPLAEGDYRELERSGITRQMAIEALLFRLSNADAKRMLGRNDSEDYAGIVFPYFTPGESYPCSHRVRRDSPPMSVKKGKVQPEAKYLSPPGDSNRLYWHPNTPASIYTDVTVDLIFCEGQKKAIAMRGAIQASGLKAEPAGLNGVWGFRGKTGIRENSRGQRQQSKGVIPDIERTNYEGRTTYILFDTNVVENSKVAAARNELASELALRDARVLLIDLAPEDGVNGIDDFIGKHGPEAAVKLLETARDFDPSEKIANLAFTDFDNEQVFEMLFALDYRFNATARQWLFWSGDIWAPDQLGKIDRSMIAVANARLDATAKIADETEKKRSIARALKLRNVSSRRAAIESSQTNPRFVQRMEDFDQSDYLFACANGVIDLRTGDFRRGRRSDMLTKASPIEWNPHAPYDEWLRFLQGVFAGNVDLIQFVQAAVGYTLTGLTQEEVFFLLYGSGRNGKGTLLRVLGEVFGEYAGVCEASTLLNSGRDGRAPRNDIAAMVGKRLIVSQESREGAKLDESLIKSLTGGDMITARFLNQEFFTFKPTWKIWLATNHRPEIRGTDTGIWSRPKLIPFTVSFEGREDRLLKTRLLSPDSLSGVLRWAVEGCVAYQKEGRLNYPGAVIAATNEYRAESDQVGRFIEECCVVGDFAQAPARRLYEAYSKWAVVSQTGDGWNKVLWERMSENRSVLFRGRHFRDEIIVLCLRWYLRYPLSYRNLEEIMAERGLALDHSTIARWVLRYAPVLNERIRSSMRPPNRSWRVDETYVRVAGKWAYLYRAINSVGNTIDFLLSPQRDLIAAKSFLQLALLQAHRSRPRVINVDGHPAYPAAIEILKLSGELGSNCQCRRSPYLNNLIEQDHRFVKKRVVTSQWFRSVDGALNTIAGYEAMNIIRKGQIRWIGRTDIVSQNKFIDRTLGIAA